MKSKTKNFISVLLTLALILGLFAAMPVTASAANKDVTIAQSDTVTEIQTKIQDAVTASNSGDTVTVTGSRTGVTEQLELDIQSGKKVIWKADYSGTTASGLVLLFGSGVFEVGNGGSVKNNGNGIAIFTSGANATVTINGGAVSAASECAIGAMGANSTVMINSGTVSSPVGDPTVAVIAAVGDNATVEMNGGTVNCTAEGIALGAQGPGSSVKMTGGTVNATAGAGIGAIGVGSSVTMSGGTVTTTTGVGIGAYGDNSEVKISGGDVSAATGIGIGAIGINSAITIGGGKVSAVNQAAIAVAGTESKVTVNGGFVFAHGTAVTGEGNVINMLNGSTPNISGVAVVCAWDKPSGGTPDYDEGSTDDLTILPAGAAAAWGKSGSQNGINYKNGSNTGFFPISGVTVSAAAGVAPAINGPTSMTLTPGYAATSTGLYTVTGSPAPTVTIKSGNAAILWNGSSKKLEIGAGLPKGTYNVTLLAVNTAGEAEFTFTLTVADSPTYANPFTDIKSTDWFYNDVLYAYNLKLINGKTATTFAPNDNLTYAEAVKLAACMYQFVQTGTITLANESPVWYSGYVTYAKNVGLINRDYDWNSPATRAGYMEIFSNAVPLNPINTIADGAIPDVPMSHPQAAAIYKLYRAGILQGVDGAYNCSPGSNIKRNEVATVISRMMGVDNRLSFTI